MIYLTEEFISKNGFIVLVLRIKNTIPQNYSWLQTGLFGMGWVGLYNVNLY